MITHLLDVPAHRLPAGVLRMLMRGWIAETWS
jgi:hypothetical protein